MSYMLIDNSFYLYKKYTQKLKIIAIRVLVQFVSLMWDNIFSIHRSLYNHKID